jgi:hypothetical protein
MTEISILYSALIIFKIFTIGLSPADLEFRIKATLLVIFQLIMNVRISMLYFEGLEINKDLLDLRVIDKPEGSLTPSQEV